MRARGLMCVGAAVLALAACGQGNEGGDGATAAGESSSAASSNAGGGVAAGGGTTVEAVQSMLAKRRAGKWRMTMGVGGQTTPPTEICITEEQNREQPAWDPKQSGASCPDFRARRQGDAVVMTANCPDGQGGSVQMETKMTGDGETRYRMDSLIRRVGGAQPGEVRTMLDMQYLGPC